MTGYEDGDILRSLQRYYSSLLGEVSEGVRWEWRRAREEVADDARPVAVLDMGAPRPTSARASIDQGNVVEMAPYTVTLYPAVLEVKEATAAALSLSSLLRRALTDGIVMEPPTYVNGDGISRPIGGPFRVPLWDWTDVAITGTAEERTGPDAPHDHLWVEDVSSEAIQDPMDAKRWTVVSDVRVSWERPGRIAPDAPMVGSIGPAVIAAS